MSKVTLKNVTISYKGKKKQVNTVVNDANVVFPNGKVSVILGPSGCGKTSILRCIAGIHDFSGDILFDDVLVNKFYPGERNVSYVSQIIGLYPHKTIFNNIAFPLKILNCSSEEIRERVYEVAELLKITPLLTRKPKELSIGQAQRVAIARALVKKSNVYLFDEPFSNLDKPLSEQLTRELKHLFKEFGNTVIFVSHSTNEAINIADKIYVMNEGQFIFSGNVDDLYASNDTRVMDCLKDIQ